MVGHSAGGCGALEAAALALSIAEGSSPRPSTTRRPDPECDLDYVPNVGRAVEIRAGLSNIFGFGGPQLLHRPAPGGSRDETGEVRIG